MKIAVTTVFFEGEWPEAARDVQSRLGLMREVIKKSRGARVVVLPAGFFRVSHERQLDGVRLKVETALQGCDAAVLWGIDVGEPDKGAAKKDGSLDPAIPSFAFLRLADGSVPICKEQQIAATSKHSVKFGRLPMKRIVQVGRKKIGVIICGEMLGNVYGRHKNAWKTRAIVRDADVVLDLAHANVAVGGPRSWMGAIEDCSAQRPVMVAQHLAVRLLHGPQCGKNGDAPYINANAGQAQRRTVGSLGIGTHPAAIVDLYAV